MEPKTYLSRYRIVTGSSGLPIRVTGGAGERTYKAEDITTGEAAAIELVPAADLQADLLQQLETEAIAAKQLNHINIPKLYDFGFEHDHLVYASELFDGTTADAWVTAQGPMPVAAVLRIAQQVVGALGAATFHGILHHAINPRNIIIVPGQTTDGQWPLIKVLNFVGIAPEVANADAGSLGAAQFASPEQLENGTVDFRSEIYSLGKTLSFLLTGVAIDPEGRSLANASGIPASVKTLVAQMVSTDPGNRPLDPLAFQRHINDLLGQVDRRDQVATKFGLAPAQPVVKDRTRPAFVMKPLAWAALLCAVALIGGLVIAAGVRPGGWLANNDEPIGVPVGVPDPVTAPAEVAAASAASQTAPAPAAPALTNAPPAGAIAANNPPPVLTSVPEPSPIANDAAPANDDAAAATTASEPQQSKAIASNNAPVAASAPGEQTTAPAAAAGRSAVDPTRTVASNNNQPASIDDPASPGAGPNDEQSQQQLPAEISETANSYAVAKSKAPEVARVTDSARETDASNTQEKGESTAVAASATPRPKKSARVASASKRRQTDEQYVDARRAMPPVPRGAVRAQYLGTTPDGELVFGLPSSERGYVGPAEPRRRRSRRAGPPPGVEVLPAEPAVLPALPVDDDE